MCLQLLVILLGVGLASTASQHGNIEGSVWEYIVVGSGAAGSAVAGRLAHAGRSVLLVEAGDEPGLMSKIPGAALMLVGTEMDWAYRTLPNNESCLALDGEYCRFVRGKALGGSTSINLMMYSRGNRRDFDFDVPGWSWDDMMPYFLRAERLKRPPNLPESSVPYHNFSGAIPIENFVDSGHPWHPRLIEGFRALNFPWNPDVNAASQIGVSQIPGYVSNGERVTAARAYLAGDRVLKHLKVLKNTQCVKVIIDENDVARGVTVLHKQKRVFDVFAKREVILSAGAIGTPHILMLSGVGPRRHLERFNITVRSDLPVGENMSDHVVALAMVLVDHDSRSMSDITMLIDKSLQMAQWMVTRSGPLATVGLGDVTAFFNSKCYDFERKKLHNRSADCEIPTVQTVFSYMDKGAVELLGGVVDRIIPYKPDVRRQLFEANARSGVMAASPVLLRPASRGRVRLASADPAAPPEILSDFLRERQDAAELGRALRVVQDLVDTPAFAGRGARLLRLRFPGCVRDYWDCYVRHMTLASHHAVGTAALGAVVDDRLRVRGVRGLRVADASVLPLLPRGNTAAAVVAVGERLADFLLAGA
ncbi:glucose dehydrogenase [FAD, quinone]-like [Aricia agestis]|uniref:glucose dehydrogenase [FAD, quinone]-like n=1 Tax=Aricia agestis TaxID=91739 RepID=UPI001C203EB9|nr:glucose dehydrogenase [FAD, quinone]-like [Aricia agestis]